MPLWRAALHNGAPYSVHSETVARCDAARGGSGRVPRADFDEAVARFASAALTHLPTPLEELAALPDGPGWPRLLVKRDDQTGLALGGNKARKLDLILADARSRGHDSVVTWAGVQSNWARMTAAGCRRLGMRPILALARRADQSVEPADGNLLLDRLFGAEIHVVEPGDDREQTARRIAAAERAAGRNPYLVSVGGSTTGGSMDRPLGAIAYARAFAELLDQADAAGVRITHVVHASGSGGTQAGLLVGARALAPCVRIVGISDGVPQEEGERAVARIARETIAALGLPVEIHADDLVFRDEYYGEGYGIVNRETVRVIVRAARSEGLLLDPVYTGKALLGLLDLIETGFFGASDAVVFLHTGGAPGLFPYRQALLRHLPA